MGTEIQSENSKIQHIPSGMKEQESIDPNILRTLESSFWPC